jgi:hypothetical protein
VASKKLRPLRNEWIERRVAKDPKANDDKEDRVNVRSGERVSPWYAATPRDRAVTQECKKQKRQRKQQQRIQHERRGEMTVHKLMKRARRAAAGTRKSREKPKGTRRKKTSFSRFEQKEINRAGDQQ